MWTAYAYLGQLCLGCAPAVRDEEVPLARQRAALGPPDYSLLAPDLRPPDSTNPAGTVFGPTPFKTQVDDLGNARISIPIWTPPGRLGIEPRLSLEYTSAGGNGILGLNWSLSGVFSVVSKCRRSRAVDGTYDLGERQAFCLDGNRLLPVAPVNSKPAFRTEIESWQRIIQTSPDRFEVQPADGPKRVYDRLVPSKDMWRLRHVVDRLGNGLTVTWNADETPGSIQYTSTASPAVASNDGKRSVVFSYEPRLNPRNILEHGFPLMMATRLRGISLRAPPEPGAAPVEVKFYRLDYVAAGKVDVLKSVQECDGKAGKCRAPVLLETTAARATYTDVPLTPAPLTGSPRGTQIVDVDGDGRSDVVAQFGASLLWFQQLPRQPNALPRFGPPLMLPFIDLAPSYYPVKGPGPLFQTIQVLVPDPVPPFFVDLDGDGVPEVIGQTAGDELRTVYKRANSGYVRQSLPLPGSSWLRETVADFDVDGRPDLVVSQPRPLGGGDYSSDLQYLRNVNVTNGALTFEPVKTWRQPSCSSVVNGIVSPPSWVNDNQRTIGCGSLTNVNCAFACNLDFWVASALFGEATVDAFQRATEVVVPSGPLPRPVQAYSATYESAPPFHAVIPPYLFRLATDLDGDGVPELVNREHGGGVLSVELANPYGVGTWRNGAPLLEAEAVGGDGLARSVGWLRHRVVTSDGPLMTADTLGLGQDEFFYTRDQTLFRAARSTLLDSLQVPGLPEITALTETPVCFTGTQTVKLGDFDEDGLPEFVTLLNPGTPVPIAVRGGGTVTPPACLHLAGPGGLTNIPAAFSFPELTTATGDVDGDGLVDLVSMQSGTLTLHLHDGTRPGLVTAISQQAFGVHQTNVPVADATFEHAVLGPDSGGYTPATGCRWPQQCPKGGLLVARRMSLLAVDPALVASGQQPARNAWVYEYEGGRFDLQGRGWLGFSKVRTRHDVSSSRNPREIVEREFANTSADRRCRDGVGGLCDAKSYIYDSFFGPRTTRRLWDSREYRGDDGRGGDTTTFVERTVGWSLPLGAGPTAGVNYVLKNVVEATTEREGALAGGASVPSWPQAALPAVRSSRRETSFVRPVSLDILATPSHETLEEFEGDFVAGTSTIPTGRKVFRRQTAWELPTLSGAIANDWAFRPSKVTITDTDPDLALPSTREQGFVWHSGLKTELSSTTVEPNGPDDSDPSVSGVKLVTTFTRGSDGVVDATETSNGVLADRRNYVFTYDPERMFLHTVTNPKGHVTTRHVLPSFGLPVAIDDELGVRLERRYDTFGQLKAELDPRGRDAVVTRAVSTGPAAPGAMKVSTRRLSRSTHAGPDIVEEAFVDTFGRTILETKPGWNGDRVGTTRAFDTFGQMKSESLPFFMSGTRSTQHPALVSFGYDNAGRLVYKQYPDLTTDGWSRAGLKETHTKRNGFQETFLRDARGRTKRHTDLVPRQGAPARELNTEYAYYPFDLVRSIADPQNNVTEWAYDVRGRASAVSDLDRGARLSKYNSFDEVKSESHSTTALVPDVTVTTHRDQLGRVKRRSISDGSATPPPDEVWQWDPPQMPGLLYSTTSSQGVVQTFGYRKDGALTSQAMTLVVPGLLAPQTYQLDYSYDDNNRLSSVTYPGKPGDPARYSASYAYGPDDSTADVAGGTIFIPPVRPRRTPLLHVSERNAAGQVTGEAYGNQLATTRVFDAMNRLDFTATRDATNTAAPAVQRLKYYYNDYGSLRRKSDLIQRTTEDFFYDSMDRLTRWDLYQVESMSCGLTRTEYGYDDIGNLKSREVTPSTGRSALPLAGPSELTTFEYGGYTAGPRAVSAKFVGPLPTPQVRSSYRYDTAGQRKESGGTTLTWDAFGLVRTTLSRSESASFTYDASGNRVMRQVGSDVVVTIGDMFVLKRVGGVTTHTYGIVRDGEVSAQVDSPEGGGFDVRYLHRDSLGTPELISDGARQVVRQKFEPFGRRRHPENMSAALSSAPAGAWLGYTGHDVADESMGFTNMKARLYDADSGRMLSTDPVMSRPWGQGLNPYSYVRNNPTNWIDPTGAADKVPDGGVTKPIPSDPHPEGPPGTNRGDWKGPSPGSRSGPRSPRVRIDDGGRSDGGSGLPSGHTTAATNPLVPNTDFLASYLGGRIGGVHLMNDSAHVAAFLMQMNPVGKYLYDWLDASESRYELWGRQPLDIGVGGQFFPGELVGAQASGATGGTIRLDSERINLGRGSSLAATMAHEITHAALFDDQTTPRPLGVPFIPMVVEIYRSDAWPGGGLSGEHEYPFTPHGNMTFYWNLLYGK